MSLLLAGGVAGAYIVGVVGLHRLNVHRHRAASGGFPTLRWLDWDSLLEGLLPPAPAGASGAFPAVQGGGPAPALLCAEAAGGTEARHALLKAVVCGEACEPHAFESVGFSGGQARWLSTLSLAARQPDRALERLETGELASAAELYLRERLLLSHRTHAINLELSVFSTKRRLTQGIARFGEHPALFYVRALASSLLGFNKAAIDDLARAVYFSRQARFYLRAVVETPYVEEVRPALVQQCRLALGTAPKAE